MEGLNKLSEAFLFIRNGKSIKQSSESSGIPITRIETIANRSINLNKTGYADVTIKSIEKFKDYLLDEGDILMSHINSPKHLGKTAIYDSSLGKIIHGMNLLCLRANREKCIPRYANYFFKSNRFLTDLKSISNKSVNQASFSVGRLKGLTIPLPPLETQKRIAQILDDAAALRDTTAQLLKEYDLLAQSIFLEMFGDPFNNQFDFEKGTIRDLLKEAKYGTSSKAGENGKYKYLRMNNLTYRGYMEYDKLKYVDIPEKDLHKYEVKKGDLLFNRTNSKELVGKTAVFDSEELMIAAGYLIRLRTNEKANPYFIWGYLNSRHGKLILENMCKNIVGMANINAQELQDIKILHPSINLQNKFAEKIALIEQQKTLAKEELQQSIDLFNCLLQKAFKGKLV